MHEPVIFDYSHGQRLRINMISAWLKNHYKELGLCKSTKIVKLSIDGGFTCPNRDGNKGFGGCLFCSETGSGDMASSASGAKEVRNAMDEQVRLLKDKWSPEKYDLKYIAYFQSHTNTYAPVQKLKELFEAALEYPNVVGIAIATRADSISDVALEYLTELNHKTFMWVELGLQTIHDETQKAMNTCCSRREYDECIARLHKCNIRTVTHLILGLPGESREMMLESAEYVSKQKNCFGIKFHMLNVVKGSGMETENRGYVPFASIEEYVNLIVEILEKVPQSVTIHRLSADAHRSILISPEWSYKKRTILNMIHKTMEERNTWQGRLVSKL